MKNAVKMTVKPITALCFAPLLLLVAAGAGASPERRWDEDRFEPLVGTWKVQVTTYDCATGVMNPPFESLLTFAAHGTLTATTNNPVFLPGQRSGEHGSWQHLGANNFVSTTEAFIEFGSAARGPVPPFVRGSQQIEQGIELTGKDTFKSEATLTFFDETDAVVATGCAKATATRLRS